MKTCLKCRIGKPTDAFTKRKLSADGLHPWCRECKNAAEVARRAPIREQINAVERERYRTNPEPYKLKEQRRMADPVKAAAKIAASRRWLAEHSGKISEYSARYREKNLERRKQDGREWHHRNRDASCRRMLKWQKDNRARSTAASNMRYAGKLNATPSWLTEDHKTFMQVTYAMANGLSKLYGIEFHVDHIHPLRGEGFCGLHVPWNLQVLPAYDNQSKGNRLKAA